MPLLYEIPTRCWLREMPTVPHRPATLADVPEAILSRWRERGITHVWLMGLWPTGPRARQIALEHPDLRAVYDNVLPAWNPEDVGGSPYAPASYQVPEEFGGTRALRVFRERLNSMGLRLILDFIPNHVGLDHPWVREHPEYFVHSRTERPDAFPWPIAPQGSTAATVTRFWVAHGRDPYYPPWTDTAQLDLRNPATRRALIETLLHVADQCDGVRCDMAMLVLSDVFARTWADWPGPGPTPPGEFWAEAIEAVRRKHPGFQFLAEVYWGLEARLQSLGFDYTYDKVLYDLLVHGPGPRVQQHLLTLPPAVLAAGIHFLENHDEPRAAAVFPPDRHRAALWIAWALPGLRFLHQGQETGARVRLPVQLQRRPPEPPDACVEKIYEETLRVIEEARVGQGQPSLLTPRAAWPDNPSGLNFVLVSWVQAPDRFTLVAVNYAPHPGQCNAPWPPGAGQAREWHVREHCAGWTDRRQGPDLFQRGIYLDLPAWGVQVLTFERA